MPNNTSHHILNTAANLLGFCLIVLTSLHFASKTENSIIDDVTSIVALMLVASCLLSFISIRIRNGTTAARLEAAAESFFILSLLGIFSVVLIVTIQYWLQ